MTDTIILLGEQNFHRRSGEAPEKEVRVTLIPEEFEEKLTRFRFRQDLSAAMPGSTRPC